MIGGGISWDYRLWTLQPLVHEMESGTLMMLWLCFWFMFSSLPPE